MIEACYLITILTTFEGSIWDLHLHIHFNNELIPVIVDLKQIEADWVPTNTHVIHFFCECVFSNILLFLVNPMTFLCESGVLTG